MKKGILLALLAAIISGISVFYNKLVVVKGIDSTVFNILKNGGVAIVASLFILTTSSRTKFKTLSKNNWFSLFAIAFIGGSIPFVLFFEGLKSVPAINATLIQKSLFIWAALLAIPFLKEKISKLQIIGFLLITLSNFYIGGFKGFLMNGSELIILCATIFWAVENVIAKKTLKSLDAKFVIWGRMFLGTFLLIVYALFSHKVPLFSHVSSAMILPILGSVVLLSIYVFSFYSALTFAPVTIVTSILILATPITNTLSAIFLTHSLDANLLLNLATSVLGIGIIAFVSLKSTHHEHTGSVSLQ